MKRFAKFMLGVTLLEIMLVLAIAAMIIVMSVRYYQAASASQQANGALEMIQAITATADGIAQGTGSYSSVSQTNVAAMMPGKNMNAPWGGAVTIKGGNASKYDVSFANPPPDVCALLLPRLAGNPKYSSPTCLKYTYDASK